MRRLCLLFILFSISLFSFGQRNFWEHADTLNKPRLIGASVAVGSIWSGSMIGLSQVWYADVPKTSFHTFDDSRNWLQMDKAGHFYTAYKLNQLNTDLFQWTGLKDENAIWIGTGISTGYQLTLEMFDAYSAEWGFSWSDLGSNIAGTFAYAGQQFAWGEERIIPKFSYHSTEFAKIRPEILGSSYAESLLKDYNGQTYWLSVSPGTFFPNSNIPKWACFSVGYGVNAKLKGDSEYYIDPTTGIEYSSQRELLFSLDIDFSKLEIKRKWLKTIVKQFNYIKVPFPTLILRNGQAIFSPLYF